MIDNINDIINFIGSIETLISCIKTAAECILIVKSFSHNYTKIINEIKGNLRFLLDEILKSNKKFTTYFICHGNEIKIKEQCKLYLNLYNKEKIFSILEETELIINRNYILLKKYKVYTNAIRNFIILDSNVTNIYLENRIINQLFKNLLDYNKDRIITSCIEKNIKNKNILLELYIKLNGKNSINEEILTPNIDC